MAYVPVCPKGFAEEDCLFLSIAVLLPSPLCFTSRGDRFVPVAEALLAGSNALKPDDFIQSAHGWLRHDVASGKGCEPGMLFCLARAPCQGWRVTE